MQRSRKPERITEPARQLPVLCDVDVAVFGGGLAGLSAAVAAARTGAKTALIERFGFCGGLATGGLIIYYWVLDDGRGRNVIAGGLNAEILRRLKRLGGVQFHPLWRDRHTPAERAGTRNIPTFDPEAMKLLADRMLDESGVQVFHHAHAGEPIVAKGRIQAVPVETKAGRQVVRARTFIDCTGDAEIAFRAGCPCVTTPRERFTAWFRVAGPDVRTAPEAESFRRHAPVISTGEHTTAVEKEGLMLDPFSPRDITRWEMLGRESAEQKVRRMRKSLGQDVYLVGTPTHPNVRRTRRIVGLYELGRKDLGVKFDDSIGRQGLWTTPGEVYHIPYRCLVAQGVRNLLAAGRCVSTTADGWEITRIISACVLTGQAAGVGAALVAKGNRRLDTIDVAGVHRR